MTTLIVASDPNIATRVAIDRRIAHFLTVTKPEGLRNVTAEDDVVIAADFLMDLDEVTCRRFEAMLGTAKQRGCAVEKVLGPREIAEINQLRALLAHADPDDVYIHPGIRGWLQVRWLWFLRSSLATTPAGLAALLLISLLLLIFGLLGLNDQLG